MLFLLTYIVVKTVSLIINLVLLVLVGCTNTPFMETSWVLLRLACFFDLYKVDLPYLTKHCVAE